MPLWRAMSGAPRPQVSNSLTGTISAPARLSPSSLAPPIAGAIGEADGAVRVDAAMWLDGAAVTSVIGAIVLLAMSAHYGLGGSAYFLALLVLVADTFRIVFFADDFHMLDVARRVPLFDLLGGQHGIFPWYRPLSRELYFWLVTHAGPLELVLARVLSLGAVALAALQLRALGARWFSPRAGVIAAVLFIGFGFTKFLLSWGSGFQDLLATALLLLAVREHTEQRGARALLWAVLACFAKETAALVFPLLIVLLPTLLASFYASYRDVFASGQR